MLIPFFYTLNLLILFSGLLGFRQGSGERHFTLALVQTLFGLPLLACEYFYLAYHLEPQAVQLVLFSEIVFTLIWLSLALRMRQATQTSVHDLRLPFLVEIIFGAVLLTIAGYFLVSRPVVEISDASLFFSIYSPVYFSTVFVLIIMLYFSWRLEEFWRSLDGARRWEYKFLVVGGYLVCGALAWSSSYRLTYLTILPKHLQLLSALLFFGWAMMSYAVFHHRLLNRKIFVSRKVVYAFVVPSLLATYLLSFGIVSLLMRTFGLEMSFILKWLFLAMGLVAVGLFAFSGKIRRKIHFFISTHFYINKYEYRDEWLALSQRLQGASNEAEVVSALREVLAESLYTTEIFIWLEGGDSSQGYKLVSSPENPGAGSYENNIGPNDPLVYYLHSHSCFHINEKEPDQTWREVRKTKEFFLASLKLTLIAPISIGNQLTGLIGLGPEFTGGQYGHDDFDLLTALGSQTASALLAVRMAEKLAHAREQQAWHRLSAFVLHDIKNAATMLSLLQENAPEHIHEPEFQQDMLELVDDALRRMGRVEKRLGALKDELTPEWQNLVLGRFLQGCIRKIKKKLPSMEITIEGSNDIQLRTDPELLGAILENLLLNAYEAQGEGTVVRIKIGRDDDADQALVEIVDNGPGIAVELLPDALFEPFKTRKDEGSGIGLWQVKRVVTSLGGTISANNNPDGGAQFVIRLPLAGGVE
jgi:putative PEP-CTERM system histidine kinase